MPLSEIPPNVRRSDSTSQVKPPSEAGSGHGISLPPTAIQTMLKTTTELGDIGQFATRPPRIPRSGSRIQSARPRSGSFDTAFGPTGRYQRSSHIRHPGRHHGPRPTASMSGLSARHTSRSNISSSGHSGRPRRYPQGLNPYALQGIGSPGPATHGLYTHRSLVTLRSNRDLQSVHSNSPRLPPGRMRRPANRASSPAYSNMRSFSGTPRPGFRRAPSTGTVASSPGMFSRRPGLRGYCPDTNASCNSLTRLPSPAVSFIRNGHNGTPGPPLRTPTPMSPSFQGARSMASSSGVSIPGIPKSHTGSTVPAYYDYSESFMEEDCFSPDGGQDGGVPPLTMDQTILEGLPSPPQRDAQTPFGTREGSAFRPSELATKHNRRSSEQSKGSNHLYKPKYSFNGVIPKRVSSLVAPASSQSSPAQSRPRRTRSEDSGPSDITRTSWDARRASITSKRSITPSSTSIFFPNAARSSRDLTTLAARVHSPPVNTKRAVVLSEATTPFKPPSGAKPGCTAAFEGRNTPNWQLPTMSFRPISFAQCSPTHSTRPRTSEATPSRKPIEILSPMPERPMSSQSRRRFSKILEIEDSYDPRAARPFTQQSIRRKAPMLNQVEEGSYSPLPWTPSHTVSSVSPVIDGLPSPPRFNQDGTLESNQRISQVTSHDKSTIESLLDKHIECLGLRPESEGSSDESSLQNRDLDGQSSADDTIRLTDILTAAPNWPRGRPWTSSSQQISSLGYSERQKLRPRRLFGSMDAGVTKTIVERSPPAYSTDSIGKSSLPSYGWQNLPSSSQLVALPKDSISSVPSGELGDIDSSEQRAKLKIKRRSKLSTSTSMASQLSELSAHLSKEGRDEGPPRRSKSEIASRQASHRRRRKRIMLRLKTKSRTLGDILDVDAHEQVQQSQSMQGLPNELFRRRSSLKSPVAGYAELSADSVLPSMTTLGLPMSKPPPIPARWSSIVAAMPEPVRKSADIVRRASERSNRSRRSNTSIVQPINTTRLNYRLPRLGSIPKLAPPEFGPTLTASDLNLSIPYADVPSTIRPTLRETKSFFSDDSSARRQLKNLREKFALHSLRHALPGSSGTSVVTRETLRHGKGDVKLSHSCQMKGRKSLDGHSSAADDDILPMSDFAYRKRKVLERIKDWWRRQCVPRKLASGRRRGEHIAPGGTGQYW